MSVEEKVLLSRLFALPFERLAPTAAYRLMTLHAYGVVPHAIDFIVEHSTFEVDTSLAYGGGWYPPPNWIGYSGRGYIKLRSYQDEACIHENSHVWWHWRRKEQPWLALMLASELVKVADMDAALNLDVAEAIYIAQDYVYGTPSNGWPGMFPGVADVHNLTPEDMDDKVIDWEIFAGLCSFTMGQFKAGRHKLPSALWPYLDRLFTGTIWRRPYFG